ncbi:MAG: MerR family transcriptional regulator, partial [Betaproteobacteria bacterium]|nr:MerR family transcriptional regulator [Betaproteobacteria bacterium]
MDKHRNISDFARRIGRSASTVRRRERDGLLKNKRLPSGHRYFDEDDVRGILGKADEKRLTVVYCRVPSHGQKDDLQSQVSAMEQYCLGAGIAVDGIDPDCAEAKRQYKEMRKAVKEHNE